MMGGKYWFTPIGGDEYAVGVDDKEIAITKSWETASKIAQAINHEADDEPKTVFAVVNRVKEWRLRRDLTQAQLADLIDVHQGTIAKYEQSKVGLDLDILERLANALQVAPSLLISNGDKK